MHYLIIGTGNISIRHVRNIATIDKSATFEICRSSKTKNPALEVLMVELKGKATLSYDLGASLKKKLYACIIANPTSLHIPTCLKVLPYCRNILIEKPLADKAKDLGKLAALARKHKAVILIGYCLRFHPVIKKAKEILASGLLGKIYFLRAEVGSYLPGWKKKGYTASASAKKSLGGGVILELSHELDYIYWLLGKPDTVKASAAKVSALEIETEDIAEIICQYKTGTTCGIHLDYLQQEPVRKLEIVGEKGKLTADLIAKTVNITLKEKGKAKMKKYSFTHWEANQMYLDEMVHFLECVKRGKKPLISLEEGTAVLELCLQAKKSAGY